MRPRSFAHRRGFTLLELLVVIAILAIIAGGLIVAYDGLDSQAAKGQAAFNIKGLDQAIRTFATVNRQHPNNYDSLLFTTAGDGTDATALDILPEKIKGKIGPFTLTPEAVAALNAVGITHLRYVTGGYPNDLSAIPSIPNRIFDDPPRGFGVSVPLTAGVVVAAVESSDGSNSIADFSGADPGTSSRLRDMAGLDPTRLHLVVVFGLGNNATIVKSNDPGTAGMTSTSLSEAPYYADLGRERYSRYLVLYHLATDDEGDGLDSGDYLSKARFLGVLDTNGDWYDEEYAEFTGQKQ